MRIKLEQLRSHFRERQGDSASVLGVGALALLLLGLAHLTNNSIIAIVATVNAMFVWVPLAELAQKKRAEAHWHQLGLDDAMLDQIERLANIDRSLDEYVDTVLSVYATLIDLAGRSAWFRRSADVREQLQLVRESMGVFFARVERVEALRSVYETTARSVRQAGRLAGLRARVGREYEALESFAQAFEGALAEFSEAVAAALASGDQRAAIGQLESFAAGMRRLTANLDQLEAERAEQEPGMGLDLDSELLDDGADEWERMLAEDEEPWASLSAGERRDS